MIFSRYKLAKETCFSFIQRRQPSCLWWDFSALMSRYSAFYDFVPARYIAAIDRIAIMNVLTDLYMEAATVNRMWWSLWLVDSANVNNIAANQEHSFKRKRVISLREVINGVLFSFMCSNSQRHDRDTSRLNASPPVKRRKLLQSYHPEYSVQYPVVCKSSVDDTRVFCCLCNTDFSVGHSGLLDVKKYVSTAKHQA